MIIFNKGGLKCFGVLLALSITFLASCVHSLGVNALKHEYDGIHAVSYYIPHTKLENNNVVWDFSRHYGPYGDQSFFIEVLGSEMYNSDVENVSPKYSASYIICDTDTTGDCNISHVPVSQFIKGGTQDIDGHRFSFNVPGASLSFDTNPYQLGHKLETFSDQGITANNNISPVLNDSCKPWSNGMVCPGLWNFKDYVNNEVLPYWYGQSGFYIHSTAINPSNGISYTNTFSLSDMYNYNFPEFNHLHIPLFTSDEYFADSDNLYEGRSIEFKGSFAFTGSFQWDQRALQNGYFKLTARTVSSTILSTSQGGLGYFEVNCDLKTTTLDSQTIVSYSCPVILEDDYLAIFPSLDISSNSSIHSPARDSDFYPMWTTDNDWRFASCYIVTDNDDTPGYHFNTEVTGGAKHKFGDVANDFESGSEDFFSTLKNLFNFGFFNPFAPIFNLFTDQNSCAQIPTIAGMIHSEETEVCPWFDSTTRNIVTPVLGLSAMMLVFGFAVRWLGARSGNFIEDSGGVDSGHFHFQNKYQRKDH